MDNYVRFAEAARMVAGMIRRRWVRWGAVSAVAAMALTGCVGEATEPTPSSEPTPSLSSAELVEAASSAYQAFLDTESAMYDEYDYDYTRLTPYVSDDVATQAVADMQETHDLGVNFRGRSVIVASDLADGSDTEVDVCVDSREVEAFDVESGAIWEATSSQITPWRLSAQVNARGEVLLTAQASLDAESSSVCSEFL